LNIFQISRNQEESERTETTKFFVDAEVSSVA